jgi:hypothetical protein
MRPLLFAIAVGLFLNTAASADQPRIRGLRETVGSVQISGWEQGLVQANPNLGHWNWSPMYANIQRIRGYGDNDQVQGPHTTGKGATQAQPDPAMLQQQQQSHYIKPNHIPLPVPEWHKQIPKYDSYQKPKPVESANKNNSSGNITGKMVARQPAAPPASYGFDYTKTPPNVSMVERTSVHGKLTTPHM